MISGRAIGIRAAIAVNAFVMPGLGHFLMGKRRTGAAMMSLVAVFLLYPIVRFSISLYAAARAAAGIAHSFAAAWRDAGTEVVACALCLLALWAFGIADLAFTMLRERGKGKNA